MIKQFSALCYCWLLIFSSQYVYAAPPAGLELQLFASGFNGPVAIRHAGDGSGRLFVVERAGVIRVISNTGQVLGTPLLDITTQVKLGHSEEGLLGLAFDPDYDTNGYFYVNYTYDPGPGLDRTRVSRYTVTGDPVTNNVADGNSSSVIIEIEQDSSNHNGGDIHFGPDGYLYIGMGDGGGGNDPNNRAQPLTTLLGKMLRIDVSGATARAARGTASNCGLVTNYSVPDNPFLDDAGACAEIWARGLRNPWRWSFDRLTGDMFIGDVGQGPVPTGIEEIDFQPASSPGGENYGWPCMEGTADRTGSPTFNDPCLSSPLTDPIAEYAHNSGSGGHCAVSGGYRYRGKIPGMQGVYFYADYCSGQIWYIEHNGSWSAPQPWLDTSLNISSFGEDEQGELYVVDLNGSVYRFHLPILQDGFEN